MCMNTSDKQILIVEDNDKIYGETMQSTKKILKISIYIRQRIANRHIDMHWSII